MNSDTDAATKGYPSPGRCFVILGILVFLAEFVVMSFLPFLPELPPWAHNLTDPMLLLLLISPALYYFVLRPLHHHIRERQRVEAELLQHREHLEIRVAQRTTELQTSNEELQREIDEHRRAEVALEESEERYRSLVELSPDAILVSTEHRITFSNRAARHLFGASDEEGINGRPLLELFDADGHRALREQIGWLEAGGDVSRVEEKIRRLDGATVAVELAATPFGPQSRKAMLMILRDITERQQTAEALRVAAEQRRLALDAGSIGTWDYDIVTRTVFWDERCRFIFGVPWGEKIEYDRAIAIIHAEDRQRVDQAIQNALRPESGGAYEAEYRVIWPDGTVHWLGAAGQVYFQETDGTRKAVRFIGTVRDFTRRQEAEAALRESAEFTQRIIESSNDCIKVLDLQGRLLTMSSGGQKLLEIADLVPYLNKSWVDFWKGEDREAASLAVSRANAGEVSSFQGYCETTQGTPKWWEVTVSPIRSDDGKISRLLAVSRDITERKRAEQALRQARDELELRVQARTMELKQSNEDLLREIEVRRRTEKELSEAEQRYRTVAEFTHDWEYWEAPHSHLPYCSPSCERITGYTAAEFIADATLLDRVVHPEDRETWQKHKLEAHAALGPKTVQFRLCRKDGGVCWVEHVGQPVRGKDGEFLGIRASNRDITQRKEAELGTQRLREELSRVARITTAGQLSASLAHELNQPLGAIVCNVRAAQQLLTLPAPDLVEVREALRDIEADSKRAGGVIHQLRSWYQKTGQARIALRLDDILQRTIDLLHSEFVIKNVAVRLELASDLPLILGNEVELQQVFLNLITNAFDAMADRERGARQILISTASDVPQTIRLSVRDSGTGLSEEQLGRIFEPFYTTKTSGMGMGLAICRSIIEAHGGRLWAENNPDCGATFHLSLPAVSHRPA